ncbi:hypothetical protein [Rhodopseudomonas sp. B29]|uniref:hypothetical protein n=1 Tax=Rhodopseudomonas sp. B29 TaxID=95607 RepID=UPI001FCACE23|nr:hypothetical protein [Rhodopseudomonas sp. B29]
MRFLDDLGSAVQRNPVSTALIGMGLVWLFAGSGVRKGASNLANKAGLDRLPDAAADMMAAGRSSVQDGLSLAGERLSSLTDHIPGANAAADAARAVRDSGANAMDRATEFGRSLPDTGAEVYSNARDRIGQIFDQQPLLLGALGLAIGAGIAASLPSTEIESEWFGETSDELKAQARDFARRETEHAQQVIQSAAQAAAEEAERQGLTPEGLMSAASNVGDKAKKVVEAAEDGIRLE